MTTNFTCLFSTVLLCFLTFQSLSELSAKGIPKRSKKEKEVSEKEPSRDEMKLRMKAQQMIMEGEGTRSTLKIEGNVKRLLVDCPLCDHKFKTIHVDKQMQSKGVDRDFCKHTYRKSAIDFDLWCCPSCGYTHLKNFFPLKVSDEFKEKNADKIKLAFNERLRQSTGLNINKLGFTLDQEDISTAIKFSQMEMVLDELKLSNLLKADFHLRFAWSERIRLCQPISEPVLSSSIGIILERLKLYQIDNKIERITSDPKATLIFLAQLKELRKTPVMEFLCLIYEAQQWDRLGQVGRAKQLLKDAMKNAPSEKSRRVPMFKLKVLENELSHIKEALISYKEAIKENDPDLDLQSIPFLIGELNRRVGFYPEAKAWIESALAQTPAKGETAFLNKWIFNTFTSLPQPIDEQANDSEKILIAKVEHMATAAKNKKTAQENGDIPVNYEQDTIDDWLERVHKATVYYYKEFNIDPDNVQELSELGLFKNDPRLEKEASKLFRLKISKAEFNPLTRYQVNCTISFHDENGYYWPSLIDGQIQKSRQL